MPKRDTTFAINPFGSRIRSRDAGQRRPYGGQRLERRRRPSLEEAKILLCRTYVCLILVTQRQTHIYGSPLGGRGPPVYPGYDTKLLASSQNLGCFLQADASALFLTSLIISQLLI